MGCAIPVTTGCKRWQGIVRQAHVAAENISEWERKIRSLPPWVCRLNSGVPRSLGLSGVLPLSRFSHGIGVRYRLGILRAHDLWAVRGAHLARAVRHVVYFMRWRDAHRAHRAGLKDESGRIRAPNARMRLLPKDRATPCLQW